MAISLCVLRISEHLGRLNQQRCGISEKARSDQILGRCSDIAAFLGVKPQPVAEMEAVIP
ncbi:hypothetical protein D3C86_2083450 [compost metagenome]